MTQLTTDTVWSQLSQDLRRFLRSRVGSDHLADDLLQETFVRIHRALGTLSSEERLTAWVYQIARNTLRDYYRARPGGRPLEGCEPEAPSPQSLAALGNRADVWMRELIDELPEHYRQALVLSELDGFTQQQVADHLGLSLPGAKSRIQRGRAMLREVLDRCCTWQRDHAGRVMDCDPRPERTVCRGCSETHG